LPRALRPGMAALYRFARYADDVADEGQVDPALRVAELHRLQQTVASAEPWQHPALSALYAWVPPLQRKPLQDLLEAFLFDARDGHLTDQAHQRWYCQHSAAPVGRLVLQLFGQLTAQREIWSDAICMALQKINFLQDVRADFLRGKCYLPLADLHAAGQTVQEWVAVCQQPHLSPPMRAVIEQLAAQAQQQLDEGKPLLGAVPGRLGWELRAVVAGGQSVLDKLAASQFDPLQTNCRLSKRDGWLLLKNFFA
jgi:hydroxysqualene synthase